MNSAPEIEGVEYDATLPVMDMERLEMLIFEDEDEDDSYALVRELYNIFNTESSEKLEGLAAACQSGDAMTARKIVHFVAGSAGNLGLTRLCGFYRGIERAIDFETLADISSLAEPAVAEYRLGCEAFLSSIKN